MIPVIGSIVQRSTSRECVALFNLSIKVIILSGLFEAGSSPLCSLPNEKDVTDLFKDYIRSCL